MKKLIGVLVVLFLVFGFMGCASKNIAAPLAESSLFPPVIRDAIANAPANVLIGIGDSNLTVLSQARTMSASRARAEIARQMNTIVEDMIRDYMAGSEQDPRAAISFQEVITVSLSRAELTGASVVAQDRDRSGVYWTVVYMSKENVATEITQAQAAARLAVPAMASFDAEARMNEAFDRLNARERSLR